MKNAARIVVKILQFILGLACLIWGGISLVADTSRFLDVEAEVLSSTEKYYSDSTLPSYELKYSYQVDGVTYTGSTTSSIEWAAGEKTTVYYNPSDPSESLYTRGQKRTLGFSLLFLGLCFVGTLGWIKRKPRRDDPGVLKP